MNKRMAVLAGVLIVGAVVAFIALRGYPPTGNTSGTIGAAQRYTSQPMTDSDIQLSSADAQAFLQSDLFHKMATNPSFRQEVKNGDIGKLYGSPAFANLLRDNQKVADLLVSSDFLHAINDQRFSAMAKDADAFRIMLSPTFGRLLNDAGFLNLMSNRYIAIGRSSKAPGGAFAKTSDELRSSELRVNDLRLSGAKLNDLRVAEARLAELRAAAAVAEELRIVDARITDLRASGQKLDELKMAEARATELRTQAARFDELRGAESRILEMRVSGAKTDELRTAESRVAELRLQAAKTDELRTAESRLAELRTSGAKIDEQRAQELKVNDLRIVAAQTEELRSTGARVADLRLSGAKTDELRMAEQRVNDLRASFAKMDELRLAESRVNDLRISNAKIDEQRVAESRVTGLRTDASKTEAFRMNDYRTNELKIDAARFGGDNARIQQAQVELQRIAGSREVQALVQTDGFAKLIQSSAMASLAGDQHVVNFLRMPELAQVTASDMHRESFMSVISNDASRGAIAADGFQVMMKIDGMTGVLASDNFRLAAANYSADMARTIDGYKVSE